MTTHARWRALLVVLVISLTVALAVPASAALSVSFTTRESWSQECGGGDKVATRIHADGNHRHTKGTQNWDDTGFSYRVSTHAWGVVAGNGYLKQQVGYSIWDYPGSYAYCT